MRRRYSKKWDIVADSAFYLDAKSASRRFGPVNQLTILCKSATEAGFTDALKVGASYVVHLVWPTPSTF